MVVYLPSLRGCGRQAAGEQDALVFVHSGYVLNERQNALKLPAQRGWPFLAHRLIMPQTH
jgi:hypothetical protein